MPEVEQVDREAAAALFRDERTDLAVKFRLGANPEPLLEAFAAHRLAERARIVAWLRDAAIEAGRTADSFPYLPEEQVAWELADYIEKGNLDG